MMSFIVPNGRTDPFADVHFGPESRPDPEPLADRLDVEAVTLSALCCGPGCPGRYRVDCPKCSPELHTDCGCR